jgi:hypothetical protein
MGYSIDHGPTTHVPISFTALVTASVGMHTLNVKCWGKDAHDELALSITVTSLSTAPPLLTASPTFAPAPGIYTSAQRVTLASATTGAPIYYTTNGSLPTTSSAKYTNPISVSASTVITAIAVGSGYAPSSPVAAGYTIAPILSSPVIPPGAIAVSQIQAMPNWLMNHDPGTIGNSQGTMTLVSSPSLSGSAAEFATSFTDWGGEIYSTSYGNDANATNFLYDTYVWIEAGSVVGNLEMDNNQVIPDGDTVIYAFQCAGDHNTWDYSSNAGTPAQPTVKWLHSNQPCNPANWTANAWHHVQITYSRDGVGNVTYESVWLDSVEQPINETVLSAFTLGWQPGDLMTNFQVDGVGASGASVLYADNMTLYRW